MASILIVDDDGTMAAALRDILSSDGEHEVAHAHDGAEGLEFLGLKASRQGQGGGTDWKYVAGEWKEGKAPVLRPAVILSDCMMPGMDGLTFVTELSRHDEVKDIPVIVLTSKAKMEEPFRQLPNVAGFLAKPVDSNRLRTMVVQVISERGGS